jgi:hypothetical protein
VTYQAELDDVRQEIRRGYASNVVTFWPKHPGVGNVAVTGTPTYEIYKPGESTATVSGSVTVTTLGHGSSEISKITTTIDASNTSTFELTTDWSWVVTYVYDGITYTETIRFDVVIEPYRPLVSLNDLQNEIADIGTRLKRQATAIAGGRTAEQHASVLGMQAWAQVRLWLMSKIYAQGGSRPFLIVDREPIRLCIVAKALELAFRAEGGGLDSESRALAEDWRTEADSRWSAMGPLSFSTTDDRDGDVVVSSWTSQRMRRTWF